jgi:sRNA-binding regulator protein Hfq
MNYFVRFVAVLLVVFSFLSGVADAQAIFLGRKAVGKVRQLTGEMMVGQTASYDAATVLLEARADRVYRKAVDMLKASKDYRLTRQDDKALTLEFTDGKLVAGLQINPLEEHLCQMLIVSTKTSANKDAGSLVLNGVLRVCKEMGVHCEPSHP